MFDETYCPSVTETLWQYESLQDLAAVYMYQYVEVFSARDGVRHSHRKKKRDSTSGFHFTVVVLARRMPIFWCNIMSRLIFSLPDTLFPPFCTYKPQLNSTVQ